MFFNLIDLFSNLLQQHKAEFPEDTRSDVDILFQILSSSQFDRTMVENNDSLWGMEVRFEEGATDDDLRNIAVEFVRMMKFRNN